MAFGTGSSTYTFEGITSSASRAAQSGPVQIVTTDASGNLASADVSDLFDVRPIMKQIDEVNEGVAMAMAMGTPTLPDSKNVAVSAQWGTFGSENAVAISGIARLMDDSLFLTGGIGFGLNQGSIGGKAGVMLAW
jgi:hypothetical protein